MVAAEIQRLSRIRGTNGSGEARRRSPRANVHYNVFRLLLAKRTEEVDYGLELGGSKIPYKRCWMSYGNLMGGIMVTGEETCLVVYYVIFFIYLDRI